jgi:choline dehydrogenase-like flavoprotein
MKADILIVGSGVGGATVAKELAGKVKKVIILEEGGYTRFGPIKRLIDFMTEQFLSKSKEGIVLYRKIVVGGTGITAYGNGVRSLEKQLQALGINLEGEFKEAEKELQIAPVPKAHMGERTQRIMKAAEELGVTMHPMPKFIDFNKCIGCGLCVAGCPNGAKWSPLQYLDEAKTKGVELLTGMVVEEVTHSGGKVTGVKGVGPDGKFEISADIVILAAGGIGTPIILQKSGISNAGGNFFADLYVNTYGSIKGVTMQPELPMAAVMTAFHESRGFLLSPHTLTYPSGDMFTYRPPMMKKMKIVKLNQTLGIMTKINDDCAGRVNIDGSIEKKATEDDQKKLDEGASISKEILIKAGCDPESIFSVSSAGAHPGGTAAIGKVVNTDLETEIQGLFVSDASVLPEAPGLPPILTIIALSKRLGKKLAI